MHLSAFAPLMARTSISGNCMVDFKFRRKFARILSYFLAERRGLIAILAFSLLSSAFAALQPWPLKMLIDYGLGDEVVPASVDSALHAIGFTSSPLVLIGLAATASIFVFAANAALDAATTMTWSRGGQSMVNRLATDLFFHLQRLSLLFHARRTVGDALSRVTGDAWSVYTIVESLLIAPAKNCMLIVSVGALAWQLSPPLTLLILCAVPPLVASASYFGKRLKNAERVKREAQAHLTAFVPQDSSHGSIITAFALGSFARAAALGGRYLVALGGRYLAAMALAAGAVSLLGAVAIDSGRHSA
ncbi:MAG: ABC transporter transmembrane domain-containing protein [Burkholderiales bacterium]